MSIKIILLFIVNSLCTVVLLYIGIVKLNSRWALAFYLLTLTTVVINDEIKKTKNNH